MVTPLYTRPSVETKCVIFLDVHNYIQKKTTHFVTGVTVLLMKFAPYGCLNWSIELRTFKLNVGNVTMHIKSGI